MQGQVQEQRQTQEQRQQQTVAYQQLLHSQLVELPVTQLLTRISSEIDDNPALEYAEGSSIIAERNSDETDNFSPEEEDYEAKAEKEERQSALDDALSVIGRDDEELPVYSGGHCSSEEDEAMPIADTLSFYDSIHEQMLETDLTERQKIIMDYLIGSLDDDGYLRKDNDAISDEMAIYRDVDVTASEVEEVVRILQSFDPPGIGARNLRECLLIQLRHKYEEHDFIDKKDYIIINDFFPDFIGKKWVNIKKALSLTEEEMETLKADLRKMNPKPGSSMGESGGKSQHHITPDFSVETTDDGRVTFTLNNGDIPQLEVSQSFADMLKEYRNNREGMSRQMKEALLYTKQKVDAAKGFIEALKTRNHTLAQTMRAIIEHQKAFFLEGDEAMLRPMVLRDIAEATGLDISTISRVCNSKYVSTRWGMFQLRYFFSDSYVTDEGNELSTREIKVALKDIVHEEDKSRPLSDEALARALADRGYPIARRTVAKYREQLGIPVARMRR